MFFPRLDPWSRRVYGVGGRLPVFSFRIGPVVGGAIALAVAACASDEPTALALNQEPAVALVSASSAPKAAYAKTELGELINSVPKSAVGGDRLNVELLRRFYARHRFAPVWTTRPAQADSLVEAVLNAGDHGLNPELFHAKALRSRATLSTLDRELLLSNAFLSYADALARGAMPVEKRRDDEQLTPEPVDVAAALDAAIASPDPGAAIEALAPTTPTYRLLRQALKNVHTGFLVGGSAATSREREIVVNLERERWLPRRLPADRVWVNVADQRVLLYRNDREVFSARVIVGQDERRNQSPEFQASIERIWFNPPWVVPEYIANEEILPKAGNDPDYLAKHNMVRMPNGMLQQNGGGNSALGHFLFEMPNKFDVYLHDTPSKNLFLRDGRRISHGCIRVENSHQLAALLMRQPLDTIEQEIKPGDSNRRAVPKPVPVFVVYETAFAEFDGRLQFRADIYSRDAEIWQYLHRK
jgi:murein L,D-transpeptidase YcbB/YkuD